MDDADEVKDFLAKSTSQLFDVYTTNETATDSNGNVLFTYLKAALLEALHCGKSHEALSGEILRTLSRLICGGKDPETELPRLKEALGAGGPCGKILQYNEPTFSCLECALDGTCVMCMDCYYASPHHAEKHNLHVNTSHGSGMCDCGDEEAWKYGHACSVHAGKGDGDDKDIEMKLPSTVRNIATLVFKDLLELAMNSFIEKGESYDEQFDIPAILLPSPEDCVDVSDRYVTVIYNDEVHNFDEVIQQFKQLVRSSHSEASAYATSIDREGRMLIRRAGKEECQKLTRQFLNYKPSEASRMSSNKEPLVTKSMPEFVFVLQNIMIDVVDWVSDLSRLNVAFKRITCNVSFKDESSSNCFIERVMLHEPHFWKKVKCAWHNLFMSAYFGDSLYKKDIGVLFVKNYSGVFRSFLEDDKVREFPYCIISLTVQLFTVPSISTMLMTEYAALKIIFQEFVDFYSKFVKTDSNISKFQNLQSTSAVSKRRNRMNHVLFDAKYILSNIPDNITTATEDAFLVFLQLFVTFISYMQEMNPHVRKSGNHILREKDWDQYFILEVSEIRQIMSHVARWCTATPRLFVKSLEILLKAQLENSEKFEMSDPTMVTSNVSLASLVRALGGGSPQWEQEHRQLGDQPLFERKMNYIEHDMFKDPVSFHIPVTRLFSIVFSHFPKFDLPIDLLLKTFTPEELLDLPLRSILLSQQIEGSMWKRNGTTMENQSMCYRDHYKSIMWDKDLLAVQLLLTLCDPEDALLKLVHKYKIEPYFVLLDSEASFDPLLRMAEAFSSLLLYVICERFRLNVSEAKESDIIRKDAIHILAISNVPRSKIIKTLEGNFDHFEEDITKTDEIDEILQKIAEKVPVKDGVKTMLKLKPEFYSEFTPFYYHYSHGQRQSAENTYYQRQANNGNADFKPPPLPPFTKLTKKLRLYLTCPVIQRFIYVVLKRFRGEASGLVSDLLLHQILYMTMFGVLDELNTTDDPLPVKFTHCLTRSDNPAYLVPEEDQCSIISLLKGLLSEDVKSVNEVKPLIRWILKTTDTLTNTSSPTEEDMEATASTSTPKAEVDSHREKMRKRREQLMANFKNQQAKFMTENLEAFTNMAEDENKTEEELMETSEETEHFVCGPNKGPLPRPENNVLTCILCKDSEKVHAGYSTMMYGCLIEKSVVLKTEKDNEISEEYRMSYLLGGQDLHIQSCGHPMHLKCLQSIMKLSPALQHLLTMTGADSNRYSFFLPKGEFSCPYCKMAANCALPVVGYEPREVPDITTEGFLKDVINSLEANNDIELMELEFSESPPPRSPTNMPTIVGLDNLVHADGQSFIEILRDSMLNDRINRMSEDLPAAGAADSSDDMDPGAKFKEDMRRFYRRAKNILDKDAIGARCYAPFTLKMISYTFSMLERILREKPLLAGLAEYQEGFFESFLRSLHRSMTISDHLYSQELTRELLYLFSPQISDSVDLPSILNSDVFTIFVAARFAIFNEGKSYDSALVELCVIAEIIKILLSVSPDELVGADSGADDSDAIHLATLWGHVRKMCGLSSTDDPFQCPTYLLSKVQQNLLPLFRKLALFLRYATSITGCAALKEIQSPQGEFNLLMRYLNISSLTALLSFDPGLKLDLVQKWCRSVDLDKFLATVEVNKTKREAKLIDLPKSYVDLLVKASKYTCPKIKFGKIQTTAVCLICGDLVCFQSYCCQESIGDTNFGPCNMHAHRCSGDLGVFLTLEKSQVLFLPLRTQGIFISGPYVDKYGEGYKSCKNKALTLSPQIYRKIELMWIRHEIRPMVSRNNDSMGFSRIEQIGLMY